ncbi:MAG: PCMD domain-containing protein [Bacteroidia bacterium]|nr:PCMD domain-containing protein [Bacteroidia bacterium]
MKKLFTLFLIATSIYTTAQTSIGNAGFELWGGNASPGVSTEPNGWYSNKSGTGLASSGPQTCYQDMTIKHAGTSSARVETKYYIIAVVNGNVTTGIVNAPSSNKNEGFLSTIAGTDIRRMAFTGRPDSLTGWYQYTQATSGTGASSEQGKIRAILHKGHYYDPEIPVASNHPDSSMNKIGDALFLTAMSNNTTWKRFSVPFTYTSAATPSYIMINVTSSANQLTTAPGFTGNGSKLWLDDLLPIYNSTKVAENINREQNIKVYSYNKFAYVDFTKRSDDNAVLTIYDLTGKVVSSHNLEGDKLNAFDMSGFNNGLYLYQVVGADYKKSGKFIIE